MLRFNLSHPQKLLFHQLLLLHALILQSGGINGVMDVMCMKIIMHQDVLTLTIRQEIWDQHLQIVAIAKILL